MSALPLPGVVELVSAVLNRWVENPAPRLMAAATAGGVYTIMTIAGVLGGYLVVFLGVLPGLIMDDGQMITVGMLGSTLLYLTVFFSTVVVTQTVLLSGLIGGVAHSRNGGPDLSFSSPFSELGSRQLGYLFHGVVVSATGFFLSLFLFVPGLLFFSAVVLSLTGMVMYGWSTRESIERCVRFAMQEPLWHLGLYAITLIFLLMLSNVPFIGQGLGAVLFAEVCVDAASVLYGPPQRDDLVTTQDESPADEQGDGHAS